MTQSCLHPDHAFSPNLRAAPGALSLDESQRSPPLVVTLIDATDAHIGACPTPTDTTPAGTSRLPCDLNDARAVDALRGWLCHRMGSVDVSCLARVDCRPALERSLERSQIVILRRLGQPVARVIAELLNEMLETPEIILIDAPHPVPLDLHEAGIAVAFQLHGEPAIDCVGQAVLDTLRIHVPLRESCQRAVGKLPLRDTLALVRVYMLREAFRKAGSKRGAARELGVSRPAVQQMLRNQTPDAGPRNHPAASPPCQYSCSSRSA